MGGTAVRPEPQLFWKILQAPPLKMNRQIFGPELDDDRRDELDILDELDTPAELEDPGGAPLEPPRVVWDERDEFEDAGDFDELGERDELDGPGTVIEIEDMALPWRDAVRTDCVSRTRKATRQKPHAETAIVNAVRKT